jgi:hypothetical protein
MSTDGPAGIPSRTNGSGVPRRLLAQCLRDLRLEARLPVKKAAAALEWSEPKLWRIETGQTALRSLDVQAMCAIYGAPSDLTQALAGLARHSKTESWWHALDDVVPGGFDIYATLEEHACELRGYEPALVPALLRTADYARALITASHPAAGADEIGQLVRECRARQMLVARASAPLSVTLILSEAVLRCPVVDALVMAGQLRDLAELAALPNVQLRVVPFSAGLHPGQRSGPFTLLRFPPGRSGEETDAATVYVPELTGELYLDKPDDVRRYDAAHAAILSCALDEPATLELLRAAAKEFEQ